MAKAVGFRINSATTSGSSVINSQIVVSFDTGSISKSFVPVNAVTGTIYPLVLSDELISFLPIFTGIFIVGVEFTVSNADTCTPTSYSIMLSNSSGDGFDWIEGGRFDYDPLPTYQDYLGRWFANYRRHIEGIYSFLTEYSILLNGVGGLNTYSLINGNEQLVFDSQVSVVGSTEILSFINGGGDSAYEINATGSLTVYSLINGNQQFVFDNQVSGKGSAKVSSFISGTEQLVFDCQTNGTSELKVYSLNSGDNQQQVFNCQVSGISNLSISSLINGTNQVLFNENNNNNIDGHGSTTVYSLINGNQQFCFTVNSSGQGSLTAYTILNGNQQLVFSTEINAIGSISVAAIIQNGSLAIALNTENRAISCLNAMPFHGSCVFNGKTLFFNQLGLFEYGGVSDREASLKTGNLNLDSQHLKKMAASKVYLAAIKDSEVSLVVTADNQAFSYQNTTVRDGIAVYPINVGQGLRFNEISLEVKTTGSLTVESIDFEPIEIKRRDR